MIKSKTDLQTYLACERKKYMINSNNLGIWLFGGILSQMFLSDLKFNSITREVELISKNGTKTTYSLKTFIDDVHKTLMQSKAIYCDKLPTCAKDSDGNYIVTYVKGGTTLTTSAANTWFYYKDSAREDVQTIFVDGEEITIQSGTIGDVVAIDPVSKNWLINGVDTGESSKGDAGKDGKSIKSITKDDENNIIRLIEFDGEQHQKAYSYFGGEEKFKKIQTNDSLKNQYALSHNIPLVRIPYSKRNHITLEMLLLNNTYLITNF